MEAFDSVKANMKRITAKFKSKCAQTGRTIDKGEEMIYDYKNKKCYSFYSLVWSSYVKENGEPLMTDDAKLVQAQEEAYYDNFCKNNNI